MAMIAFIYRPRAFRFDDGMPRRNFSRKMREVLAGWLHSITAAAMLVTLLLFAAMAILVVIYTGLFLGAFILSILGVA